MAIQDITKPMALDETLQATNQALGGVAKDTSLQATNTALGLLGKDSSLQAIVTALATIGLNTVGNLAQLTTEQKTSLVAAINELMAGKIPNSAIGVANGVAELDANGLVPSSQIPDAVDEIIEGYLYNGTFYEDSAHTKPITGKTGKIYVDLSTEKTYRWGGSAYVEISASLALGETSSTAYRGDRGKTAYDHSQDASRVTSAIVEGLYKIGATAQGHISSLSAVQKSDITALGIPGQDTTYNDATQSVHGLMSASDKTKLDGISAGANKVEDSSTNGNIKIDNVETQVYDDSDIQGKISTTLTPISGNPISISGLKSTQLAVDPVITFEPIQDLHGQSKPYPERGGKNLMPMTVEKLKEANTSQDGASWSGNSCTYGTTVFTILTDSANNVTGIKVTGTAPSSDRVNFHLASPTYHTLDFYGLVVGQTYAMSGCPSGGSGGGSGGTFNLTLNSGNSSNIIDAGSGNLVSVNTTSTYYPEIRIFSSAVIPSGGLIFYPQIELGSSKTDFAPFTNYAPISGYDKIEVLSGGKNLFDGTYSESGKYLLADGSTSTNYGTDYRITKYISVKPNTSYTLQGLTGGNPAVCWYDSNYNYIGGQNYSNNPSITVSLPANAKFMKASWLIGKINEFQIEEGSTATTYQPYHKTTDLSESFGQTVYGGSLDVRTGKFTVTKATIDLGSLSWTGGSNHQFYADNSSFKIVSVSDAVCSQYQNAGSYPVFIQTDKSFWMHDRYNRIMIYDTAYSDAGTFETAMSGVQLVYELATPFTIQLTPHEISLLEQYAYLSTNGSLITLSYHQGEMASLADVSQLGETVNELGGRVLHSKRITKVLGNVTANTRYEYFITDDYPYINENTLKSISLIPVTGNNALDYTANLFWTFYQGKVSVIYYCKVTQSNAYLQILVLY